MDIMLNSTGGSGDGDDNLPGQPWPGPTEEPQPDGESPESDGKHRR